jgi:myo-inositol catabolism protein IolC
MVAINRACRHTGHEWLFEIITARDGKDLKFDSVASIMEHFYKPGARPALARRKH